MADLTAATLARIPDAIDAIPAVVETVSPLTVTIDGATHAAVSWMGDWQHHASVPLDQSAETAPNGL